MRRGSGDLARFGVSLGSALLADFDGLIRKRGYTSRSEAIGDLVRGELLKEDWRAGDEEAAATVTLVYDHDALDLPKRLTEAQHAHRGLVVSSLHVHLSERLCLEILVLRGKARRAKALGERLASVKGVLHGEVALAASGRALRGGRLRGPDARARARHGRELKARR